MRLFPSTAKTGLTVHACSTPAFIVLAASLAGLETGRSGAFAQGLQTIYDLLTHILLRKTNTYYQPILRSRVTTPAL
jgi:hypothetical protein